jgi:hypothetical protein
MSETAPETPPVTDDAPPAGDAKVYDEAYVKALRTEAAGYRTRLRETETTLTSLQSDLSSTKENLPALETRATKAERDALRYRVALESGLTLALANRLVGDDEESIKADASVLKSLLGEAPPVDLDQGLRTPPPATKASVDDALRALMKS